MMMKGMRQNCQMWRMQEYRMGMKMIKWRKKILQRGDVDTIIWRRVYGIGTEVLGWQRERLR
jgi:hypothetical protein